MKENRKNVNKIVGFILAFVSLGLVSGAQNLSADSLPQKFIAFQLNHYNEKLFVHTDKTVYLAGESMWFKIYCVDANFHKPSDVSKVAYVEIISSENKPVLQAKILLNEGSGNGSFIIPSYVVSGNYIIRAYTKWMENFDADYFFEAPVTIINTLKTGILKNDTAGKLYDVNFFPEGGNLVEGVTSTIAFKAVDKYGEPAECSGTVYDAKNNIISNFQSLKFGMGSFSFTPKAAEVYKAVIKLADTTITKQLPVANKQGFVMHVENAGETNIKIEVSANTVNAGAVYLLIHSQNVLRDFQQANVSDGKAVFVTSKNKLIDGISTITIFNKEKQPVCERLYFKNPASILNIQMRADKNEYEPRDHVNISLSTTSLSKAAMADMSASVFMIDSLQSVKYNDILSYLLLSAELKGNIISPSYYFQNTKEANEAADNLMLTQGWRRFKWDDILQAKKPLFEFIPEHEGMIINGEITANNSSVTAAGINATLSVAGINFQLANAVSDSKGNLHFNIRNFYGLNNLVIQADSNYKATIIPPYSNNFSATVLPVFTMPLQWQNQLLFRSINVQAENAYLINEKQHSYNYDTEDTSSFYGAPDKRYYLDDYTRFITMEEVMREYVTEVHVKKEGTQYHYSAENSPTKTFFESEPLILLDGVPVSNTNSIIEFDPLKIKRLDVVARKYYYGNMVADGIVSYSTYNGDLANFPLKADNVVIKFDGLQREREFYSPVYDNESSIKNHLPDLRNVLYWSPKIKTGTDGKTSFDFYTSDVTGKFACIIQGITPGGIAGSSLITFDVAK